MEQKAQEIKKKLNHHEQNFVIQKLNVLAGTLRNDLNVFKICPLNKHY